ncbi:sigma 54-interacting transcriptional regulator [Phreatobacter sp.]|uniref:sigma 54-interacting transcriptional regulator n=1 Tax=Phreatobacter sp. TaxID=1966341 RepID=UPI0022CC07EF|nr:sigma 54-interacting transcriptional regulator [Phreatobacter sp.]MCZ8314641.1 sigma 54-interacting transcriptional regulator [Phreatobacter sp.]
MIPTASPAGAAFTALAEAALVIDPGSAAIVDANPAAERLLGYPAAALRALRVTDLHRGQRPALVVFTEEVLHKGVAHTRSLSPLKAGGGTLRVEYAATVLRAGAEPLILLTMVDLEARLRRDIDADADGTLRQGIDEWKRVERLFHTIEKENQLILKAAGEGIYGVNADGKTTFVNPAAEALLGWTADELVGKDMHSLVHHHRADGSPYPNQACPIYAAFRNGAVQTVTDEVFWKKDGTPLWVEYTSTPIRERGAIIGAVIVFRDVSQRREAEEKLRQALAEVDSLRERLERENAYLQEEIRLESNHRGIIGRSAAIQKVQRQIDLVAPTDATVLVTGESGTGKELIGRAIHEASSRRDRPLIRVNCAAIPRELFESEFFGHVRGAFTGALRDRIGRFELADGGTLFLDEVGEIPLELQGKLLRILQEGQFERVGEERTRSVDVRVIAATNRDLRAEVRAGRFREDLYFRLDVFPIHSAPLRERIDDVAPLALHFLRHAERKLKVSGLGLSEGDVRRLAAYDWPGNVRELQNVIERAAILARNGRLAIDLPGSAPRRTAPEPIVVPADGLLTEEERRQRDRRSLVAALELAGGKISGPGGAAERLGLRPTTFASRLKAHGLDPRAWRGMSYSSV